MGDQDYGRRNNAGRRRPMKDNSIPDTPEKTISDLIIRLGDSQVDQVPNLLEISKNLIETQSLLPTCLSTIFSCVLALSHKINIYASFVGLLVLRDSNFAHEFVKTLLGHFQNSFKFYELHNLKLLTRFVVELANANVLSFSTILTLFETIVNHGLDGVAQHISDFYVSILLGAILCSHTDFTTEEFWNPIKIYMEQRRKPTKINSFVNRTCKNETPFSGFFVADYGLNNPDWLQEQYEIVLEWRNGGCKDISVLPRLFQRAEIAQHLRKIEHVPNVNYNLDWFAKGVDPVPLIKFQIYQQISFQKKKYHGLDPRKLKINRPSLDISNYETTNLGFKNLKSSDKIKENFTITTTNTTPNSTAEKPPDSSIKVDPNNQSDTSSDIFNNNTNDTENEILTNKSLDSNYNDKDSESKTLNHEAAVNDNDKHAAASWIQKSSDNSHSDNLDNLISSGDDYDSHSNSELLKSIRQTHLTPAFFTCPRPRFSLFPRSDRSLPPADKWILENILLDIIYFFRASPELIPNQLVHFQSIPDLDHILINAIFCDFFRPFTNFPIAHYGTVILHFSRENPRFYLVFVEAIERFFGVIRDLNAPNRDKLLNLFSFHLNSTNLNWNWDIWAISIEQELKGTSSSSKDLSQNQPPLDGGNTAVRYKYLFITELLQKCIAFSYYENVLSIVKSDLLISRNIPASIPLKSSNTALQQLMTSIVEHKPKEVIQEMINISLSVDSVSPLELLSCVVSAILEDGISSMSHLQASFGRYMDVLTPLKERVADFEQRVLQSIFNFYIQIPHRALITIIRFVANNIISSPAVVSYFFESEILDKFPQVCFWELMIRLIESSIEQSRAIENEIIYLTQDSLELGNSLEDLNENPLLQEKSQALKEAENKTLLLLTSIFQNYTKIEFNDSSSHVPYYRQLIAEFFPFICLKYRRYVAQIMSILEILFDANPIVEKELETVKFYIKEY